MIPTDLLHLLTTAIDGELSPAEDRRVRLLLAESAEARELYARLQADRARLQALPKAAPPADLRERVMARIAELPVPVVEPATAPATIPFRQRRWVPLAVAASLMIAVAGASFGFFLRGDRRHGNSADTNAANADRRTSPTGDSAFNDVLPVEQGILPSTPRLVGPPEQNRVVDGTVVEPPEVVPLPRAVQRDVIAFPPLPPLPPLELIQVRVPFLTTVADLGRDDARQRLMDELSRDPAFRIDLFAKDPARAAEAVQAAAKANGIALAVDAFTGERMKRKQPAAYLVYTETLTPTDVSDLLARLASDDARVPQRVFESVHVTPAGPADQKDAKDLLGTDPGLWKRPATVGTAPADPKPISAGTADQVAKALSTVPGKSAILLTYAPAGYRTNPATSRELQQFLAKRGDRRPSAVPVLIVVRQPGG